MMCRCRWVCRVYVLLILGCLATGLVGAGERVDPMDHADHFYQVTKVGALETRAGKVLFKKTKSGDAFVRWSLAVPRSMELDEANDCLEIDFTAFPQGGKVQVLIALEGDGGKKSIPWLDKYDTVGRATVPSLRALAKKNGLGQSLRLHLSSSAWRSTPGAGLRLIASAWERSRRRRPSEPWTRRPHKGTRNRPSPSNRRPARRA